jgi:anthranilate phosphoribosyltransferase
MQYSRFHYGLKQGIIRGMTTRLSADGYCKNMTSPLSWTELLERLLAGGNLSVEQASEAMSQIISGEVSSAQLAGFLIALRAKGETVDEVIGFRDAVLAHAVPLAISRPALDIVGTGGDHHKTVNISSAASIICAAAGVPVLKHGNRAASSASGSSDVLSELGIALDSSPQDVERVFDTVGIGFAFAAKHHPGFKHAAQTRSELGIPTIFNILGPLCNPARPQAMAVGVASEQRVGLIVGVLQSGDVSALVFRGDEGLDELSTCGHSRIWEVSYGQVREHSFDPSALGIPRATLAEIRGGSPADNANAIRRVFAGERGPVRDIICLNAAAGLVAFDLYTSPSSAQIPLIERLKVALTRATDTVDSGAALLKLNEWATASQQV